ncbi:TPA: hypothetical protein ACH3X1_003353 [Trebouxia sp. C0004]
MLSEKQLAVYGFKLTLSCVTRWGSHVNSIQSLLDTKQAMRSLVLESRPYLEEVTTSEKHPSQTTIAVMDAVEESALWRDLEAVRHHVKPFMIATRALESDAATLDLVFTMLGHLSKHCSEIKGDKVRAVLTASLEDRWQSYDQPLCLLAYTLNPARHTKHLSATCGFVSITNAACLLEELHEQLLGSQPSDLGDQFGGLRLRRLETFHSW